MLDLQLQLIWKVVTRKGGATVRQRKGRRSLMKFCWPRFNRHVRVGNGFASFRLPCMMSTLRKKGGEKHGAPSPSLCQCRYRLVAVAVGVMQEKSPKTAKSDGLVVKSDSMPACR